MFPRYFAFESDFVESLRCVPMCVRHKLDTAGVKLKLGEWSKLDPAERAYLADMPCSSRDEVRAFRDFISLLVRINSGGLPTMMDPAEPLWNAEEVPEQVVEKAASFGVVVPPESWRGLDELERFALMKLSRPGHEGKNFVPALEEFAITHGGE